MKENAIPNRDHPLTRVVQGLLVCALLLLAACRPSIQSFTPEHGSPGTVVTINGKYFVHKSGPTIVKFGKDAVPTSDVVSLSSSTIQAKVPSGAETGLIYVTTPKGTGESKVNFRVDGPAAWTFMVYLDADNNLEPDGLTDFNEMAAVGSTAGVNIVVQMDRIAGYTPDDGDWTGTRRFLIRSGDTAAGTPVQDLGEQNMGDPNVLEDFVEWAITNYRAERYALVIWNHGDGWRNQMEMLSEMAESARTRGESDWAVARSVAVDSTDNDKLYMHEVQSALESAKQNLLDRHDMAVKLDLVGFDACLMGMVEVAYELRNVTNYVVGSEATEPLAGWPYSTILSKLVASPGYTPAQLADVIVTDYVASYGAGSDVTQSAVDIAEIGPLVSRIDAFTSAASDEWSALRDARANARHYHQCYGSCWGVDLWDFADEVQGRVISTTIQTAAGNLKAAVDNAVVSEAHGSMMNGSHGLAIYFPPTLSEFNNDPDHTGYDGANTFMPVDFVQNAEWDTWLQDYYVNIP